MSKPYQAPLNWYTGGEADSDVNETEEWLTAFEQVVEIEGRERACFLLKKLLEKGYREGRRPPLHRQHPLHQHHPEERGARLRRRPRARAPDQEHRALERDGDGGAGQQEVLRPRRPHLDLRLVGDPLPGRLPPLLPRPRRERLRRRHDLLPGPRLAGHLRPRLPRRPDHRRADGRLPPRAGAGRRPRLLSASLADARLLGVPHGVDGPRRRSAPSTRRSSTATCATAACAIRRTGRSGPSSATARRTSRRRWAPSPSPRARSSTT